MKLFRKGVVTAAALLAGAVGLSNVASAALLFDVQVDAASSGPGFAVIDSHHVAVTGTGGSITFDVWAVVTATDSNVSNDFFLFGRGNVQASGPGPIGDMGQGAIVSSDLFYQGVYGSAAFSFNQNGFTNGANVDLNGNGFKDLGALDGNPGDGVNPNTGAINSRAVSGPTWIGPKPSPARQLFYQFTMPITSLGGGDTTVIYNNTATGSQIQWKEDNVAKSLDVGALGTVLNPLGVTLSSPVVNVPEPASLGVLALGGLALLARRRKTA